MDKPTYNQIPNPVTPDQCVAHKLENNYITEFLPPHVRFLSLGSSTGKTSPQSIWPWRPAGLDCRSPIRLGEIRTSLLKGAHKISHAPISWTEVVIWKELGETHLLILESLPERQEAAGAPPGDTDTGVSNSWEPILPLGHWCWW